MTTAAGAKRTRSKDLEGIRLRGRSYQVRVFSGNDPSTGEKVYLTGSAMNEAEAIRIRNRFRTDIANNKATRSSGTLGFLITTWLDQHPADPELVSDYRALADSFIVPALGNVRLTTLTMPGPSRIEKFMRNSAGAADAATRSPTSNIAGIVRPERIPISRATGAASRTSASP